MNTIELIDRYNKNLVSKNIYIKYSIQKIDILKDGDIFFTIYYPEYHTKRYSDFYKTINKKIN